MVKFQKTEKTDFISNSVSSGIAKILRRASRGKFSAFTIAELIVVIAILAVLATIGFVALSGYSQDAKDSALKSNVRSIYVAISSESASTWNSPRYYVVHDPAYSLTGGAIIVFDGNPVSLAGGDWNVPNTNYSAGNPDYSKLKIDRDKFKVSKTDGSSFSAISTFFPILANAAVPANPSYLIVGAMDGAEASGGKTRTRGFVQVAATPSSSIATVIGDLPTGMSGSVAGLVRDVANPSSTGALVNGAPVWSVPGCSASVISGYSVSALSSGQSAPVSKATANGTVNATASCFFGTLSVVNEAATCLSGYVPSALSCIADVCWGTTPANASSTATSQSVSGTWHFSATAGQCTFACNSNYTWDGSSCKASCQIPVSDSFSGQTYAISSAWMLAHGQSLTASGTDNFGTSPANGTLLANFAYSCSDGVLSKSVSAASSSCPTNYTWNASWTAPSCFSNNQTFTCAAKPVTGTIWNSVSSYPQTWNGSWWTPANSTTAYGATPSTTSCLYACASDYTWNGSSCAATVPTAPIASAVAVRCGAGVSTLVATPPANSTVDWYSVASGGTPLSSGTNTYAPSVSATTNYYAESRNLTTGAKSATRTVLTASVDAPPVGGTASWAAQRVCAGATMTMNLSWQSGTIDRWQYSPNGWAWVDWWYAGATSVNWATANSGYSNYSFRAVLKNGSCPEAYSAATPNSIVDAPTVGGTMTANPNPVTYATNTTLGISGQVGSVVQWEYYYTSWTYWGVGTPTSVVWTAYPGYYFRALIQNGVCPAAYTSQVYVNVPLSYSLIATSTFSKRYSWQTAYNGNVNCTRSDGVVMSSWIVSGASAPYGVGQSVTTGTYYDSSGTNVMTCP